jgi:hypothetical protein
LPTVRPTAMQAPDDGHETLVKPLAPALLGFGALWMVQVDPSQVSTPGSDPNDPTLVHVMAETHDTPASPFSLVLDSLVLGSGAFSIVQVLPFHASASGC